MHEKKVWATSEDGNIEYVSLTKDRLDEVVQLMREAFFPYENVCQAIGLAKIPEAIAECDDMVIDIAMHGVSIVAVDRSLNKVAGALLSKIQDKHSSAKDFYEGYIKKAKFPESIGVFQFLIDLEDCCDPFLKYNANCLMELVFLCVHPDYGKRGIGLKLCEVTLQIAELLLKGENVKTSLHDKELSLNPRPEVLGVLCTSFKTQKIMQKLGFETIKSVSYDDLFFNGKPYSCVVGSDTKGLTIDCKKI